MNFLLLISKLGMVKENAARVEAMTARYASLVRWPWLILQFITRIDRPPSFT